MAALLERPQIDHIARLVGDLKAERIDIEGPRFRQIADEEFNMAQANDVEGGIELRLGNGHRGSSLGSNRAALLGAALVRCDEHV
ncbi:hypothetical protein [Jiella pelagia]|uniref:Uncharacterized protein n=1 Tax=Jiella pelagia TaxID=2986949 RepID=A0ABY7C5T4_9HYPH|nr:hypothetical protein [Jiella pelagia]WAP71373.1 hypothetical protein OH818_17755 [Jiella pelagia]